MDAIAISAKREFNYDQEEKFFMKFMRILLAIFILIFVWNAYSHYKQIHLANNGTAVLAEVYTYTSGERISFVSEDGKTYANNISGMFLPEHGDTLMVYYIDNPATAMPLTAPTFFFIIYAISLAGISFVLWQMKRMRDSMEKNKAPAQEEY